MIALGIILCTVMLQLVLCSGYMIMNNDNTRDNAMYLYTGQDIVVPFCDYALTLRVLCTACNFTIGWTQQARQVQVYTHTHTCLMSIM